VDWVDDPDSRVNIVETALQDLQGVARLSLRPQNVDALGAGRRGPDSAAPGLLRQLGSFGAIGVLSTAAYSGLYWLLRPAVSPAAANVMALLVTAAANTAANRRFTFGVRGRNGAAGDQLGGLLALGVALLTTNVSIAALRLIAPQASRVTELVVLAAANAISTLARFVLLRALIFGRQPQRRSS
jgi:putative flippase GtrA